MSLIAKRHFMNTSLEKNSNKFWVIELYTDKVVSHWGRVGQTGETSTKEFSSQQLAEKYYNSKVKDKQRVKPGRRDSYTEINILSENSSSKPVTGHLSDIAVKQIKTSSEDVRKFIRWLSDINIHNITSQTSVQYNIKEGSFTTPLGLVDQSCLSSAKDLLEKISTYVLRGELATGEVNKLVNSYLRFLPQDLGGSHQKIHLKDVFGTPDLLQKQLDIISGLETAISSATSSSVEEKVFDTQLEIVTDNSIISEIKERFDNKHYNNQLKNVYSINVASMVNQWNSYGSKLDNRTRLWHGTNPAHILSIFKQGLIITRSYNGSRFGRGLYFSDKASMSLNYANSNNGKRFMFVSEVALGNVHYGSGEQLKEGYHSRWAEKNLSSSQVIIYRTDQSCLVYLCELSA